MGYGWTESATAIWQEQEKARLAAHIRALEIECGIHTETEEVEV